MLFLFLVKFIELVFIFFSLKISSSIPFSYIFGSNFSYLTFFSGAFPPLGSIFPLSTLLYFIFNKSLYNKIGSISSSIVLYLFTKNIKYHNAFASINLLVSILILIFFTNIPFLYSLGWMISILLLLNINMYKKNNLFIQSFISSWIGHAYGTLYSYFFTFQLSKEMYISIIPIVWVERIILTLLIYLFYKLFNNIQNNFINKYFFNIIKNKKKDYEYNKK